MMFLSDALIINSTLQVLDLSNNSIDSEGIRIIAEAFKKNKGVAKLILCYLNSQ